MAFYVFEGFIITLLASLLTLHILIKSRRSKSSSFPMDWPILGMLPSLVGNLHNLQEYVTDVLATSSSSLLAHGPLASGMRFFATCDPANIRHIFTTNHANYLKGEHFGEIFDIMQGGLFTVDGESCRRQRGRTQSILSNPRIVSLMSSCSLEKVARGVVPFLTRMATTRTAFDLQDLITRFTFDFTVMPIFSVDPGLLSSEMPPMPLKPWIRHMVAGRDTIGSTLSWFFYNLAKTPHVVAAIRKELKPIVSSRKHAATTSNDTNTIGFFEPKDLKALVYLQAALLESLRLYPPAPFERKTVLKDDVMPSGHEIRSDDTVIISLYALGRMESVWGKDCRDYRPERWLSDDGLKLRYVPSHKFLAFNSGPRMCIGKDIAIMQMKIAAAAIVWNFDMEVLEGQTIEPKLSCLLQMKNELMVMVNKRRNHSTIRWSTKLKDLGLNHEDWLYYLKPGYTTPAGLVLIMDDSQCNQLLIDHEGKDTCVLYIVTSSMVAMREYTMLLREQEAVALGMREGVDNLGMTGDIILEEGKAEDSAANVCMRDVVLEEGTTKDDAVVEGMAETTSDESSDLEIVNEHEIENRLVDATGNVFEDALYIFHRYDKEFPVILQYPRFGPYRLGLLQPTARNATVCHPVHRRPPPARRAAALVSLSSSLHALHTRQDPSLSLCRWRPWHASFAPLARACACMSARLWLSQSSVWAVMALAPRLG
ncbi:hypothetical protein PR202_ga27662 [Eleusine coracana subsp. coracana]|uniref:Uncharacterized protein n=1 Tax=Eleusine coracana subsp. coracana TaxID=191504 RepID=A0AAV5DH98_ELECO|nr:hypothetical protein PR202_ga27662 [Eleusine coracana subsp. coracana]